MPTIFVPLARAYFCIDCEVVHEGQVFVKCPACASEQIVPLAKWLDREKTNG